MFSRYATAVSCDRLQVQEVVNVTYIEQLIEAVAYAQDYDCNWWEVFDSIAEAHKILKRANTNTVEENQITCLLSAMDLDGEFYDTSTAQEAYITALEYLKEQLEEIDET